MMYFDQVCSFGKPIKYMRHYKTSLLRRLQAQTLPNVTQPIGKINTISKMTVTFEPLMQF